MEILSYAKRLWPSQRILLDQLINRDGDRACPSLATLICRQVDSGGKRLRATMPALVAESLQPAIDGEDYDSALWCGLALELVHTATLCHDDVMDEDAQRHGSPTIWHTHGIGAAILVGDTCFYLAQRALHSTSLSHARKLRLLCAHSDRIRVLAHGQSRESQLRSDRRAPTLDEYSAIARHKTGALLAAAFESGGYCAGADSATLQALQTLGYALGEVYQIC